MNPQHLIDKLKAHLGASWDKACADIVWAWSRAEPPREMCICSHPRGDHADGGVGSCFHPVSFCACLAFTPPPLADAEEMAKARVYLDCQSGVFQALHGTKAPSLVDAMLNTAAAWKAENDAAHWDRSRFSKAVEVAIRNVAKTKGRTVPISAANLRGLIAYIDALESPQPAQVPMAATEAMIEAGARLLWPGAWDESVGGNRWKQAEACSQAREIIDAALAVAPRPPDPHAYLRDPVSREVLAKTIRREYVGEPMLPWEDEPEWIRQPYMRAADAVLELFAPTETA